VTEPPPWVRAWEAELRAGADTFMSNRRAAQAPTDRTGEVAVGRFEIELNLAPADRERLGRHLAQSAEMSAAAYATGRAHQPTADVVDFERRLAAAIADSSGIAVVTVKMDGEQSRKVRAWLVASAGRAGDAAGLADAIGQIRRSWELFVGWNARQEVAESARPPRVISETGGWDPM
jgi:hypothetical protein